MERFIGLIETVNDKLNAFAWGPIMLFLLVGTGIYLTVRTHCIQVTKFGYIMRNTVGTLFRKKKEDSGKNLTPFHAVTTAMAGLGSAPIAHAASSTKDPGEQAMWGMFEVFMDTIAICTITSLAVLLSDLELGKTALDTYASNGVAQPSRCAITVRRGS